LIVQNSVQQECHVVHLHRKFLMHVPLLDTGVRQKWNIVSFISYVFVYLLFFISHNHALSIQRGRMGSSDMHNTLRWWHFKNNWNHLTELCCMCGWRNAFLRKNGFVEIYTFCNLRLTLLEPLRGTIGGLIIAQVPESRPDPSLVKRLSETESDPFCWRWFLRARPRFPPYNITSRPILSYSVKMLLLTLTVDSIIIP
jgi:hypothetical protein